MKFRTITRNTTQLLRMSLARQKSPVEEKLKNEIAMQSTRWIGRTKSFTRAAKPVSTGARRADDHVVLAVLRTAEVR
ncbi:hypothetical protein [Sorangium sp. So ce131]|uniref:hypothetical protein n=1 Tax=Sorangium sp. So ce131 TaxID=3133282 RepID=UPI003F5EBA38